MLLTCVETLVVIWLLLGVQLDGTISLTNEKKFMWPILSLLLTTAVHSTFAFRTSYFQEMIAYLCSSFFYIAMEIWRLFIFDVFPHIFSLLERFLDVRAAVKVTYAHFVFHFRNSYFQEMIAYAASAFRHVRLCFWIDFAFYVFTLVFSLLERFLSVRPAGNVLDTHASCDFGVLYFWDVLEHVFDCFCCLSASYLVFLISMLCGICPSPISQLYMPDGMVTCMLPIPIAFKQSAHNRQAVNTQGACNMRPIDSRMVLLYACNHHHYGTVECSVVRPQQVGSIMRDMDMDRRWEHDSGAWVGVVCLCSASC